MLLAPRCQWRWRCWCWVVAAGGRAVGVAWCWLTLLLASAMGLVVLVLVVIPRGQGHLDWKENYGMQMAARIQTLGLGPYKTPEVWPGQRREHGPEKPGARNVARTEARARFREAKSILIGKNYGMQMTARIPTLGVVPYRGPKCGQD